MNLSQPLVTPEELHCLLGWPLPASQSQALPPAAPPAPAHPAPASSGMALTA